MKLRVKRTSIKIEKLFGLRILNYLIIFAKYNLEKDYSWLQLQISRTDYVLCSRERFIQLKVSFM